MEAEGRVEKSTRASFGPVGGPQLRCSEHKLEGHVDLNSTKCIVCLGEGIRTRAIYAQPGDPRPQVCSAHKREGDVDVVSKRCAHEGCSVRASFGPVGGSPMFCANHKGVDDVNVVTKRCAHEGCNVQACFGPVGGRPAFCVNHKGVDDVDVVSKRCKHPGEPCGKHPSFGPPGGQPQFCNDHKVPGADINLSYLRREQQAKLAGSTSPSHNDA